jgi:hypothetical protein
MECRKQQFDKKTAKSVLNHCKKEHRSECRIYECQICHKWHLTSLEEYEPPIAIDLQFNDRWDKLKKGEDV